MRAMVLTAHPATKPPHRLGKFWSDANGRFRCIHCTTPFTLDSFRDDISVKEAGISRLCQSCQDYAYAD
jgi:hypothetical protein